MSRWRETSHIVLQYSTVRNLTYRYKLVEGVVAMDHVLKASCVESVDPSLSPALRFEVHSYLHQARAATLHLPHGPVMTPVFMPVGTKGSIKGLTSEQLYNDSLAPQIILGNTYHLGSQPGR